MLARVRGWLRDAAQHPRGLAVLTGAGMSAEGGIPTFRDAMSGLWSRFDPAELASEPGFRADPARVWRWYAERRDGVRRAQPNAGHLALADFDRRHPGVLTVITQNVDDLHQRAGNTDTMRLHGDILQVRWLAPCPRGQTCDPTQAVPGDPPRCADCGQCVRPGVVWFGESLPAAVLQAAEAAVLNCRLLLVVGTSGSVWPAAGLAGMARQAGARVVLVNPEQSDIDAQAHACLRGGAATVLPAVLAAGSAIGLQEDPDLD
jgi:NAD-dependent deacetylase